MAEIENIDIDQIIVGNRLRTLSEPDVVSLMASIKQLGLIQPIVITWRGEEPHLVAGCHRLEAARRLGWETITCVAPSVDEDAARLIEIDENLVRNELSPGERVIHSTERKEIYERLFPETRHGANASEAANTRWHASRQLGDTHKEEQDRNAKRFTVDTAERTGRSERSIQRDITLGKNIPQIADAIGTSLDNGSELDALSKLSPEQQSDLIARAKAREKVSAKTELKKYKREEKEQALAQTAVELTERRGYQLYNVIYADPPWRFEPYSRETGMDRAADNHYPTTTLEEIATLKVPDACAPDCVLFLWATAPMLQEALEVMRAWGFSYKSQIIWAKDRIGTGYWARNKHEILLIGTKGNIPAPAPGTQPDSIVEAPVSVHSKKPEVFYEIIERLFPSVPKLEMFARISRDGWDDWGYEAPSVIQNLLYA